MRSVEAKARRRGVPGQRVAPWGGVMHRDVGWRHDGVVRNDARQGGAMAGRCKTGWCAAPRQGGVGRHDEEWHADTI
ncbi:hypothetical protein GUJ93_ZPchr0005g15125 [Zizania palustris]|uniref:Uncharacterized protein n=1 Tax=Zizania palustris TaxID=103762 RepID=A0A8J5SGB7_ZIZPA|nr:hypothetical protein GUJ93_ZPchr0005g15125 [Zizania palustris]